MMYPPFFATCYADAGVKAIFGTTPCRVYPFGEAPQRVTRPYAVFQTVTGLPENYIGQSPDMDGFTVQVDVYATTVAAARSGAEAIRDAIEGRCHITGWRGESRDPQTNSYRYSFDCDWFVSR